MPCRHHFSFSSCHALKKSKDGNPNGQPLLFSPLFSVFLSIAVFFLPSFTFSHTHFLSLCVCFSLACSASIPWDTRGDNGVSSLVFDARGSNEARVLGSHSMTVIKDPRHFWLLCAGFLPLRAADNVDGDGGVKAHISPRIVALHSCRHAYPVRPIFRSRGN